MTTQERHLHNFLYSTYHRLRSVKLARNCIFNFIDILIPDWFEYPVGWEWIICTSSEPTVFITLPLKCILREEEWIGRAYPTVVFELHGANNQPQANYPPGWQLGIRIS